MADPPAGDRYLGARPRGLGPRRRAALLPRRARLRGDALRRGRARAATGTWSARPPGSGSGLSRSASRAAAAAPTSTTPSTSPTRRSTGSRAAGSSARGRGRGTDPARPRPRDLRHRPRWQRRRVLEPGHGGLLAGSTRGRRPGDVHARASDRALAGDAPEHVFEQLASGRPGRTSRSAPPRSQPGPCRRPRSSSPRGARRRHRRYLPAGCVCSGSGSSSRGRARPPALGARPLLGLRFGVTARSPPSGGRTTPPRRGCRRARREPAWRPRSDRGHRTRPRSRIAAAPPPRPARGSSPPPLSASRTISAARSSASASDPPDCVGRLRGQILDLLLTLHAGQRNTARRPGGTHRDRALSLGTATLGKSPICGPDRLPQRGRRHRVFCRSPAPGS